MIELEFSETMMDLNLQEIDHELLNITLLVKDDTENTENNYNLTWNASSI
jgi:hypothetical protein